MSGLARTGAAVGLGIIVGGGFGLGLERGVESIVSPKMHADAVTIYGDLLADPQTSLDDLKTANPDFYNGFTDKMVLHSDGSRAVTKNVPGPIAFEDAEMPAAAAADEKIAKIEKTIGFAGGVAVGTMTFLIVDGRWVPRITRRNGGSSKSQKQQTLSSI